MQNCFELSVEPRPNSDFFVSEKLGTSGTGKSAFKSIVKEYLDNDLNKIHDVQEKVIDSKQKTVV